MSDLKITPDQILKNEGMTIGSRIRFRGFSVIADKMCDQFGTVVGARRTYAEDQLEVEVDANEYSDPTRIWFGAREVTPLDPEPDLALYGDRIYSRKAV